MKSLVHKISNPSNGSFHNYKDTKMPKKLRKLLKKAFSYTAQDKYRSREEKKKKVLVGFEPTPVFPQIVSSVS